MNDYINNLDTDIICNSSILDNIIFLIDKEEDFLLVKSNNNGNIALDIICWDTEYSQLNNLNLLSKKYNNPEVNIILLTEKNMDLIFYILKNKELYNDNYLQEFYIILPRINTKNNLLYDNIKDSKIGLFITNLSNEMKDNIKFNYIFDVNTISKKPINKKFLFQVNFYEYNNDLLTSLILELYQYFESKEIHINNLLEFIYIYNNDEKNISSLYTTSDTNICMLNKFVKNYSSDTESDSELNIKSEYSTTEESELSLCFSNTPIVYGNNTSDKIIIDTSTSSVNIDNTSETSDDNISDLLLMNYLSDKIENNYNLIEEIDKMILFIIDHIIKVSQNNISTTDLLSDLNIYNLMNKYETSTIIEILNININILNNKIIYESIKEYPIIKKNQSLFSENESLFNFFKNISKNNSHDKIQNIKTCISLYQDKCMKIFKNLK